MLALSPLLAGLFVWIPHQGVAESGSDGQTTTASTDAPAAEVELPEKSDDAEALPYIWGARRIAGLLDDLRRNGEVAEIKNDVIRLSKQYRIATPYTSFLVLENEAAYDKHGVERKSAKFQPPKPKSTLSDDTDHCEYKEARGDSLDFVSDKPFTGARATEAISLTRDKIDLAAGRICFDTTKTDELHWPSSSAWPSGRCPSSGSAPA